MANAFKRSGKIESGPKAIAPHRMLATSAAGCMK